MGPQLAEAAGHRDEGRAAGGRRKEEWRGRRKKGWRGRSLGDSEETHAPSGGEEVLAWGGVRHVG